MNSQCKRWTCSKHSDLPHKWCGTAMIILNTAVAATVTSCSFSRVPVRFFLRASAHVLFVFVLVQPSCFTEKQAHRHTRDLTWHECTLCFVQVSRLQVLPNARAGGGEQVLWVWSSGGMGPTWTPPQFASSPSFPDPSGPSFLSPEPLDLSDLRTHRVRPLRQPPRLQALWGDAAHVRHAAHQPPSVGLRRRWVRGACTAVTTQLLLHEPSLAIRGQETERAAPQDQSQGWSGGMQMIH